MDTALDYRSLLYRWGFVIFDAANRPTPRFSRTMAARGWTSFRVPPFRLTHHPETRIARYSLPDAALLVIGDAFVLDGSSVADRVARIGRVDDASLALLAQDLSGRFALVAVGDFGARIFHDAAGSRTIYYSARGGFAAGSHPKLVAQAVGAGYSKTIARFTRSPQYAGMSTRSLPGDMTQFDGIYQLIPNNYLDSDAHTHRYWPIERLRPTSLEEFSRTIDAYLDRFVKFVCTRWTPLLGVTGGSDSRTLVAAFKSSKVPFESFTWRTTRLGQGERDLVDQQVSALGAPHRYIWLDHFAGLDLQKISNANSERRGRVPLPPALIGVFGGARLGKPFAFVRGWGAEALRGFYQFKKSPMVDFSPEHMARAYWVKVKDPECDPRAWAFVLEAFSAYRRRANYEALEGLGYDPNDIFYLEHRMGKWCGVAMNEFDPAMANFIGFNARPVFLAAWGLPPEDRLTKQLLLRVVARHDAALAAVPTIGLAAPDATTPPAQSRGPGAPKPPELRTAKAPSARIKRRRSPKRRPTQPQWRRKLGRVWRRLRGLFRARPE